MATRSIFSILLFMITYLLLVSAAIGIMLGLGYLGIMIVVLKASFITIMLALALVMSGVFTLVFLVKFIFKKHTTDRSHLVRITADEHPKLFALINEVVKQVGTHFPKRVYLSSDINASVFYNSSFWSMFLPVRKNLQIGVGLINAVSTSELKAILAHEFGHFSQRSMKLGSYVYNVNQVIYNMLYENEGYGSALSGWANTSGYFQITSAIAVKIIQAIQYILRKVYGVVNLSYMALSREMEFHADAVAAHVTGPKPLVTSLLRLSFADDTFNSVLGYYGNRVDKGIVCKNVYHQHQWMMNFIANENSLEVVNNLPMLNLEEMSRFDKTKLVIKDQWSSHPSTEDRVKHLNELGLPAREEDHSPATSVLTDAVAVQEMFTSRMFDNITYNVPKQTVDTAQFVSEYSEEFRKASYPRLYNGYYDRKFTGLEFPAEPDLLIYGSSDIETLFNDEAIERVANSLALEKDLASIKQIGTGTTWVKTFDYDGHRYKVADCEMLVARLEEEHKQLQETISTHDKMICSAFRLLAREEGKEDELRQLYKSYNSINSEYDRRLQLHGDITRQIEFLQHTTPYETIEYNLKELKPAERALKSEIRQLLQDKDHQASLTTEMKESLERYIDHSSPYFNNPDYDEAALKILFDALGNYETWLASTFVESKRALLHFQANLVKSAEAMEVSKSGLN